MCDVRNVSDVTCPLFAPQISDVSIHQPLAVFTSLLVARHCFSLDDIILHVAMPFALCDFCKYKRRHQSYVLTTYCLCAFQCMLGIYAVYIIVLERFIAHKIDGKS